jgi:putative pyruvate formate lyase activating enzyme
MNTDFVPRYVLLEDDVFEQKINKARALLKNCDLCPRQCGVDRFAGQRGYCGASEQAEVSHWQLHFGEEPVFSQNSGAGTIFFAHCNLKCVYCQNYQISQQQGNLNKQTSSQLAQIMLSLQEQKAQNIDLVSPTHFMPQIIEAVYLARKKGLDIPIVYNTNGYEMSHVLELLDGIIDIYMPDLKYDSEDAAYSYSETTDYVYYAHKALKMMFEQVGPFKTDNKQQAVSGLFIRHLVLPNDIAMSRQVLDFIKHNLGTEIGLSIMSQYAPCYRAYDFKKISRCLQKQEYDQVIDYARELGFEKCWIQQLKSNDIYFPDFEQEQVF